MSNIAASFDPQESEQVELAQLHRHKDYCVHQNHILALRVQSFEFWERYVDTMFSAQMIHASSPHPSVNATSLGRMVA